MKVYVVGYGERGEGHDPHAACLTLPAAKRYTRDTWGIRVSPAGADFWVGTADGVDQATITRLEIRGAS